MYKDFIPHNCGIVAGEQCNESRGGSRVWKEGVHIAEKLKEKKSAIMAVKKL